MTFVSQEPGSTLALVSLDNLDSGGTALTNPAKIDTEKMNGKALRISGIGKVSQFWFAPNDSRRKLDIKVKALANCQPTSETNRNRPVRILLKAYQALTSEDYNLAAELAKKAAEVDATLSAPYIITGLAAYKQGKKDAARVSFSKAKSLDPEDSDISTLLRMVQ